MLPQEIAKSSLPVSVYSAGLLVLINSPATDVKRPQGNLAKKCKENIAAWPSPTGLRPSEGAPTATKLEIEQICKPKPEHHTGPGPFQQKKESKAIESVA